MSYLKIHFIKYIVFGIILKMMTQLSCLCHVFHYRTSEVWVDGAMIRSCDDDGDCAMTQECDAAIMQWIDRRCDSELHSSIQIPYMTHMWHPICQSERIEKMIKKENITRKKLDSLENTKHYILPSFSRSLSPTQYSPSLGLSKICIDIFHKKIFVYIDENL